MFFVNYICKFVNAVLAWEPYFRYTTSLPSSKATFKGIFISLQ